MGQNFVERWRILSMKADEIHLWNGRIAAGEDCFLELYASLSQEEIEKANGFRFDQHRRHYIICRGLLRTILAGYLDAKPAEIHFQYGNKGKPFLLDCAVRFSVSHSEDRVLYAFSEHHELGVDLEYIRELPDVEMLAQHFFAPFEFAGFCNAVTAGRKRAFFCCWTRKEAYIKATGQGLSLPLDSFYVPTESEGPAKATTMAGSDAGASDWTVIHLDPAPGYVGALASPLASTRLLEWTFESVEECRGQVDSLFSERHRGSHLSLAD